MSGLRNQIQVLMNEEAIKQSAGILALTRVRNQKIDALPEEYRPADEAEAYVVQDRLHSLLDEAGYGKRVGYKIGCTTPVMQRFLGISNPCAGGVFNTSTNYIATTVEFEKYSHPGVECEIAAFIGQDLVPGRAVQSGIGCARGKRAIWRDRDRRRPVDRLQGCRHTVVDRRRFLRFRNRFEPADPCKRRP